MLEVVTEVDLLGLEAPAFPALPDPVTHVVFGLFA